MTAQKLDPNTRNNDIGLYWTKCRRVDPLAGGLPYEIPELATGMIAETAGYVVLENTLNNETNVVPFEAGEWKPISYNKVLSGATIDGVVETTTATGLFWTTTAANIGKTP